MRKLFLLVLVGASPLVLSMAPGCSSPTLNFEDAGEDAPPAVTPDGNAPTPVDAGADGNVAADAAADGPERDGASGDGGAADGGDGGATRDGGDGGVVVMLTLNEISGNSPDYVEVMNRGSQAVNLTGYNIVVGATPVNLTKTVAAGGYYLLALNGMVCPATVPCDLAAGVGVSNGAGELIQLRRGAVLIEQQQYPGGLGAGTSWSRSPNGTGAFATRTKSAGVANP